MRPRVRETTSTTTSASRASLAWTLAISTAAFALRLFVALRLDAMPLSRTPHYDALEYLGWAHRIAAGDFTWPVAPPHGPGYPFFLGAILAFTNGSTIAVRVIQALFGSATCAFVMRSAAQWSGERAATATGLLVATYSPLVWIDASIAAEGLLLTLLSACLWCIATGRHPWAIGLLAGLAALVRPTALLFLPLFSLAGAKSWRGRLLIIAAAFAVIAPVTIANVHRSRAFIPIQAFGGVNVYLGNSPLRDGLPSARPGGDWERIEPEAARHGASDALAEDRYFIAKTGEEIFKNPVAYLELLAKKVVRTLQNDEIRDTHSFYFFADAIPLLRFLPSFTILFALGVAGAWITRKRPGGVIVLAYCVIALMTCVALVVASRYRAPLVPGLALFAGGAVDRMITLRRDGEWRRFFTLALTILIAGVATHLWTHPASRDFDEEEALTAFSLLKENRDDAAEREARTAVSSNPKSALAWDILGRVLAARSQTEPALAAISRALMLNPEFERARVDRAHLAIDAGDITTALSELRRANLLDPRDPLAASQLADLLFRHGDLQDAAAAFERLTKLEPQNREAFVQLARCEGALHRPAAGVAHLQRAIALQPPTAGDEWLLLALLATDARRDDVAEDALRRAEAAMGRTAAVVFSEATLRFREGRIEEAQHLVDEADRASPGTKEIASLRAAIAAATK